MSQRRSVVGAKIKGKGKMSLTEDEPVFLGDFGIDKGKGKMSLTEVEPVFLGDFGIDKGKWDRGKVDGTDVRVTRSQTKNKVLELKGLRSRTSHNRLVKARGRERVTTADDESEDDIECDSSDNSESCEDDAENDSDYDSYDNSEFGEGETEKESDDDSELGEDDHEVVEDASKGEGKMIITEEEPVFLGNMGNDKGKGDDLDRGKGDGTDMRVTRSQTRKKVLEVKGLRSRTSHNRLVKARGRGRVTTSDDESEDDTECDSYDNSESCEDDAENDSDYDSSDNSEFGEGETEKDDHEVVEDASKGEGKMIVTEEEPIFLGNMGNDKGKGGDLDRGKGDSTDMRVTRSQTRKKVLEVKGLRSRTTHKSLVKASGMERVTSSDDETEDDTEWDSFNNGEFSEDDTENDTEDASSDNCEFGEGESEKDNDNNNRNGSDLGEDDHEVVEDNHEVVEDGCEDELDYVDSVQGCVFCTVCNPPTEVTRQRVQVNTPEANDMTTTEYYNQD